MSDDAARPASASSPGATLLAERRRQNLSLGDVSRQLKLAVRQVEALERDDFGSFQSAVFVHGFLRNYAKLLGLDPNPLIQAADDIMRPPPPVEPEKPAVAPLPQAAVAGAGKSRWPMFAGIAAVVVVVGLLALNSRKPAPAKPRPAETPAQVASLQDKPADKHEAASKPAAKTAAAKPAEEKRAAEKPAVEKPAEKSVEKPVAEKPAASSDAQPAVAAAVPVDPNAPRLVIRMVFEQESWVEVKDRNGNTVFGQLNAAGTRRSASGEPPLSIVIGNAAGVRLFQGDKSIDLEPHTRVDVARLTLE